MHVFSSVKTDLLKRRLLRQELARNRMLSSRLNVLPKKSSPSVAMVEASMSQHIAASRVSSHDSDLAIACHSSVSQVAKWGKLEDALS